MKTQFLKSLLFVSLISLNAKAATSFYADAINYVDSFNELLFDIDLNGVPVSDDCSTFMNEDMVLGDLGKYIYTEIKTNGKVRYPHLMESQSLKNICPRYAEMDSGERAKIITLLMTTMAHFESSCNAKAKVQGPNGKAVGLYQLHLSKEDMYDGSAEYCIKNSGYKSQQSSVCALSMLNLQIKNQNSLFSHKSYWDILRPAGPASRISKAPQLIKKALQNMEICK